MRWPAQGADMKEDEFRSIVDAARRAAGSDAEARVGALEHRSSRLDFELERDFAIELAMPAGEEWSEDDLPVLHPRLAVRNDF
jgi:hypothetical protein